METSPYRKAAIVLLGLLLAGIGGWWWRSEKKPAISQADERSLQHRVTSSSQGGVAAGEREDLREGEEPSLALEACNRALRIQWKTRWEALDGQRDPESRITHALLASAMGPPDKNEGGMQPAVELFEAAARSAPRDVESAWYYARYCANDEGCDGVAAVANLLAFESANLDGWLLALQLADRDGDAAGVANALEGAAKADYYDARTGKSFTRMNRALRGLPMPPACTTRAFNSAWQEANGVVQSPTANDLATVHVIAMASAELRAYAPLRNACGLGRDERIDKAHADACRSIFAKLADGDLLIDRLVGEMSMVELTAGGTQGTQWRERFRDTRWMMENTSSLTPSVADVARRWSDGEVVALQAELTMQGRWPPPADWLPEDERARSLIQTGRPPPESRR